MLYHPGQMKSNRRLSAKLLLVALVSATPLLLLALYWLATFPDVASLRHQNPSTTALIGARSAEDRRGPRAEWTWVPLSRISPHLQAAVIAAEDASFYEHEGFDWEGIKEAAIRDIEKGDFKRGGSTITQQLAKNLYLSSEKSLLRKAREAFLTRELEHHLTKKRILELYLNVVEWGRNVYGAEAAARHHFGKSAAGLSQEEAALLAAILPSPRRYDPIRPSRYLMRRQQHILHRMQAPSSRFARSS